MLRVSLVILLSVLAAHAAAAVAPTLDDLAWLEGEWRGTGRVGEKSNLIHMRVAREMGGRFLVERNEAMFPPAEPSTEYEIHEDAVWYYVAGGELRVKAFYIEGFVLSGVVTLDEDGRGLTIESTEVEGGSPGMRSRLTYELGDDGRLTGAFDLDWSGEGYECYQTYEFERIGDAHR